MKNFLLLAYTFCVILLPAQKPWTLQECISYAKEHNIPLQRAVIGNKANKNNFNQSRASVLPSLNAGAAHIYNFGQTIDRFTNQFANEMVLSQNFYLSSNLVLWSGLRQHNQIKANEYNYLGGLEQTRQREYDLALEVATNYINVIFTDELLRIAKAQSEITTEQLERTIKMVNAGASAKSLEFDIRAQLANEELNVTTAANDYEIALLTLRQSMNLDSVSQFSIVRPEIELQDGMLLEKNVIDMYETSLRMQPQIKSAEYNIKSSEYNLAASRSLISPVFALQANIGTGTSGLAQKVIGTQTTLVNFGQLPDGTPVNFAQSQPIFARTPFQEQFRNNFNQSVGFTLNIPLFNGLQTHTAIRNAKLNAWDAKLNLDLTKQNLYKSIAQAHANAKAALNRYNASKLNVEAAAESFKYAQQKFNAGAITAFDFNTSKNRLYVAESRLLQAKYDYVFKLKVLDYYQGVPLGF